MCTYIALHLYELKLAIMALVVELGLPVVALVEKLITGGRLGVASDVIGLCLLKGGTACDDMNVGRDDSREDNGITTLDSQWCTVDSEKLRLGALEKACEQRSRNSGLLERHFGEGWAMRLENRK